MRTPADFKSITTRPKKKTSIFLPRVTSVTSHTESMQPMVFGWAGFMLPLNTRAASQREEKWLLPHKGHWYWVRLSVGDELLFQLWGHWGCCRGLGCVCSGYHSGLGCTQPKVWSTRGWLTVLVDEHPYGDAAGVKTVQEVLDVVVSNGVLLVEGILVLDHPLSHGGNHLVVAVPDGF